MSLLRSLFFLSFAVAALVVFLAGVILADPDRTPLLLACAGGLAVLSCLCWRPLRATPQKHP